MGRLATIESRPWEVPEQSGPQARRKWRDNPSVVLAVILAAQLMVVLDATIVNVALPRIQHSFGFSNAGLSWVLNAYILTFGGLLLLGARAGDIFGRRRSFMLGIAVFGLSSLAGGLATTGWMLLASRALQGIGGALAAPASLALLTTVFPEGPARVRAIGLFTTVSAAGGATGLVAGGLLTQWTSWRWVMFVNVPIGLAVWLAGRAVLAETERRPGRFDLAGALTSTAGMAGIVLGLVEAGTNSWSAPVTAIPLAAGTALLAAFVGIETRVEQPILPMRLLSHPGRNAANASRGLVYAGMYGMFFFLTQFLQDNQGYSPLVTGLAFLPIPTSVFLSSQVTSRYLTGRVPPKILMLTGTAIATVALFVASWVRPGTPYFEILVCLIMTGIGSGISLVSLTSASLAGVAPGDAGAASGLTNVAQQIGAALGLAVLVTVFGDVTRPSHLAALAGAHARSVIANGIDASFTAGAILAAVAFAIVLGVIRTDRAGAPDGLAALEVEI